MLKPPGPSHHVWFKAALPLISCSFNDLPPINTWFHSRRDPADLDLPAGTTLR